MKYAFGLILLTTLLLACGSDSATAEKDLGTPPGGSRTVAAPEKFIQDTIPPDSDVLDSLMLREDIDEEVTSPKPSKPVTSKSNVTTSATPPTGLVGKSARDEGFVDIMQLDSSIRLDIRYATENNFTESQIYDCPRCLLRPETAQALVQAHRLLQRQGMGLKLFDCYRPQPYQQRLWDKVPNPDYVAPPKKGSMHSRGAAVDLTIVDAQGKQLDMGTPYDFFGREAHYSYSRLPSKVIANRRLLRKTMEGVGLRGIRTEWWHFSYRGKTFPLSSYVWECPVGASPSGGQ